jgi:hypothetical protein
MKSKCCRSRPRSAMCPVVLAARARAMQARDHGDLFALLRAAPQRELPACVLNALGCLTPAGSWATTTFLGTPDAVAVIRRAARRTSALRLRVWHPRRSVGCREDSPVGLVAIPQRGGRCLGDCTSAWGAAERTFPVMVIPIVTEQPLVLEPTTRDDFLGSQAAPRPAAVSRVTAAGSRA